ncbi:acetylcholine receptor subunit alpha-like 1 isoform X2 [Paramacrobiotus metropolitanus]|nr:acetylcholine receptor subunit alpha-like 1 isoform X2 [Paramacrobiotus metropolitanus]
MTNVWLRQQWKDYRLTWDPKEYDGIETIQILSDTLWTPDIVLYNNADGNYEITLKTRAVVRYTGELIWEPPAIYRSYCMIFVEYFPYDEQTCRLKFGTWSYDGFKINLLPLHGYVDDNTTIPDGMDLSEYYLSIEWDIMKVTAKRSAISYSCCPEPYIDITYEFSIRRKTMYFTVNMIFPCVAISFLTVLVFYLPSDSGEKITLSISVLMSLTVFFLLLAENVPPTSLAVPLIGKYLVFTMVLVTLSIMITVAVLDVHFRNPSTHYKMSPWIRRVFVDILPRIIRIQRPRQYAPKFEYKSRVDKEREKFVKRSEYSAARTLEPDELSVASYSYDDDPLPVSTEFQLEHTYSPEVQRAIEGLKYIADKYRDNKEQENSIQDWKYVARVIDRLFLILFGIGVLVGTLTILLNAPSLYDRRDPIPKKCINQTKSEFNPICSQLL